VIEHKRCELVEPAVKVKVPAGEFTCAHVRISPADAANQTVEHLWLAQGTGLVRRVLEQDGKPVETTELKGFKAGTAEPDAGTMLAKFLQRDAGVTELGPVQETVWIEPSPKYVRLRSRFAVVRFLDQKRIWCVRGGSVTPFDPADVDQWTALVRDEGFTQWNDGLLPQARCMLLADLALRIRTAQQGLLLEAGHDPQWSVRISGAANCHYELSCTDAAGAAQKVTVDVTVAGNDQVTKVAFQQPEAK
jgi:hypothetical protein